MSKGVKLWIELYSTQWQFSTKA